MEGLLKNGVDFILQDNAYYFFYKHVIKSDFVGNKALFDVYLEYQSAINNAREAGQKLNEAERDKNQKDINTWEEELKIRNDVVIEKEKALYHMIHVLDKKIPPEPFHPQEMKQRQF